MFPGVMHDTMVHKGKRKSATVCLAVAVIVTCYLAETIDCYRLKKTDRRDGRKETRAPDVQEGEIIFGRVPESTVKPSNASEEDDESYQADPPGMQGHMQGHMQSLMQGPVYDAKEAAWRRMAPSLLCAGDQMKFKANGAGVSQLALDQGPASPMPLSQVPSYCGYRMMRHPFGIILWIPYDSCNMLQKDGSHVLPLIWQDVPVSLQCPGSGDPPKATTTTPTPKPQEPLVIHPNVPPLQMLNWIHYMQSLYGPPKPAADKKPEITPGIFDPFLHFDPSMFPKGPAGHAHALPPPSQMQPMQFMSPFMPKVPQQSQSSQHPFGPHFDYFHPLLQYVTPEPKTTPKKPIPLAVAFDSRPPIFVG